MTRSETTAAEQVAALFSQMPKKGNDPVFREPWEARAFAMTLALHEKGLFSWSQWADVLSAEIRAAQAAGDPDCGDSYYRHWLRALETMVTGQNLTSPSRMEARRHAWRRAAEATPHGEPIELGRDGTPVPPA